MGFWRFARQFLFSVSIFFKALRSLQWHVIEQAAQVACGRCDFESEELRFHETIGQCFSIEPDPNVPLLSSVLPYLEDPYQELENLLSYNIPTVIIDRTAFLPGDRDRLTVEQVPPDIYEASYPFWFLSETKFHQTVGNKISNDRNIRAGGRAASVASNRLL